MIVLTPTMADLQHEPKMCQELVYQHQGSKDSFIPFYQHETQQWLPSSCQKIYLKTSWNSRLTIQMHYKEEYIYEYFKEYKHSKNKNGA